MFVIRKKTLIIVSVSMCVIIAFSVVIGALSVSAGITSPSLTIVIDAGHGGIDGGVSGTNTGVKESDLNLAVAKKLEKIINDAGMKAVMTRKTSAGLYGLSIRGRKSRDMKKRKEIILENNPSIVISLHMNKFSMSSRRGAQVFFKKNSELGGILAREIQSSLNSMAESGRDFSPLSGDYYILNCSDIPSVIVECGFLSNAEEERLLITDEYQEKLAYYIFKGIVGYINHAV